MSNNEKMPISPITGNFSQKDLNDSVINKEKQKAAVQGGVANDLKDKDEDQIPIYQDA